MISRNNEAIERILPWFDEERKKEKGIEYLHGWNRTGLPIESSPLLCLFSLSRGHSSSYSLPIDGSARNSKNDSLSTTQISSQGQDHANFFSKTSRDVRIRTWDLWAFTFIQPGWKHLNKLMNTTGNTADMVLRWNRKIWLMADLRSMDYGGHKGKIIITIPRRKKDIDWNIEDLDSAAALQ